MIKFIIILFVLAVLAGAWHFYHLDDSNFTSFSTQKTNKDTLKRLNWNVSQDILTIPIISITINELSSKNTNGKLSQVELNNFVNNILLISKNGRGKELIKFAVITDQLDYNYNNYSFIRGEYFVIPFFTNKYDDVDALLNDLNSFYTDAIKLKKYLRKISHNPTIAPSYEKMLMRLPEFKLYGLGVITDYFYSNSEKFLEEIPGYSLSEVFNRKFDELSKAYLKFKEENVDMPFDWFVELDDDELLQLDCKG